MDPDDNMMYTKQKVHQLRLLNSSEPMGEGESQMNNLANVSS